MAETIKIGGELESMATGKIVAAASAILDKLKNKTQELINQENTSGIQANAEDIANLNAVVASLQQLIDAATITGGTVANAAEVFVAAIAGLNANNVQAALGELNDRTGGISKSSTSTEDDEIRFETDGGTLVGKIDDNGADFVNLKKNGQDVATENQIPSVPTLDTSIGDNPSNSHTPSTKAVKDYMDDNIPEVPEYPIEIETTQSEAEEVIFGDDAGTQQYVKVSSEGIRAVAYRDMQGNNVIPIKDTSIGDTPSNTNVPTTKAVKDYVDTKPIDLPITKESTVSGDEEQVWSNDAETQEYVKIGSYGIKSKAYLDMNGNPIGGGGSASNVLEVSVRGGKQFSTINSAVNYAKTVESSSNPITILIYPGVYKEVVILGAGHYISFVGVNKKDVIWRDDTGYYENAPLKIASASYIANITFIATHNDTEGFEDETRTPSYKIGSYALHIDSWENNADAATILVENCDMYSEQNASLGMGLHDNKTVIFHNCLFKTYMNEKMWLHPEHDKGAWLVHRGSNSTVNQNVILDNCRFRKNKGYAIEIGPYSYVSHGMMLKAFNNIVWSDEKGTTNVVRTYESGGVSGYEISPDSFGNNINELNNNNNQ